MRGGGDRPQPPPPLPAPPSAPIPLPSARRVRAAVPCPVPSSGGTARPRGSPPTPAGPESARPWVCRASAGQRAHSPAASPPRRREEGEVVPRCAFPPAPLASPSRTSAGSPAASQGALRGRSAPRARRGPSALLAFRSPLPARSSERVTLLT